MAETYDISKAAKAQEKYCMEKAIRTLHHIVENASVAGRISILKKDEQEAEKNGMEFLLRERQKN